MSNRAGVVSVDLEPNLSGAGAAIDTWSRGLKPIGLKFDADGAKLAAVGAGATLAGTKILGALRPAIDAASDLNEAVSYSTQVFGDQSKAIEQFGASAATSLGQSKREAIEGATTFATFGKAAGLADDDLVGFSTSLVKLSSDLASARNTSPEEAITAIGAALRGETEPIRRYGVLLDDATIRQEAMALGITKTTKDALTPQQKVLAVNSLLFKQTADSQGDFARTADGLANSQRIANAEFENAKAKLGEGLAPVLATATRTAAKFVEVLDKIPGGTTALGVAIAGIGGAAILGGAVTSIVGAGKALNGLRSNITPIGPISTESFGKLGSAAKAAGGVIAGIGIVEGIASIANELRGLDGLSRDAFNQFVGNIDKGRGDIIASFDRIAQVADGSAGISDAFKSLGKEFSFAGITDTRDIEYFQQAFDQISATRPVAEVQKFITAAREQNDQLDHSSVAYKETKKLLDEWTGVAERAAGAANKQATATIGAGDAVDQFGFAIDANKSKLEQYGSSLSAAFDPIEGAISAQAAFADGQRTLGDAQQKLNDILNGNTDGVKSAAKSLRDAREDLNKAVAETGPGSRAAEDAAMTLHDALKALHDAQVEAGKAPKDGDFFDDRRQQVEDALLKVKRAQEDLDKVNSGNSDQVISAKDRVTDAQARYNEELAKTGPASKEAQDAQREVDDAERALPGLVLAVEEANASLTDELEKHPEAIQQSIAKMDEWVARGLISKEVARQWKEELLLAAAAAAAANGEPTQTTPTKPKLPQGPVAPGYPLPGRQNPQGPPGFGTPGRNDPISLDAFKADVKSRRASNMKFKPLSPAELSFVRDLESRRDAGARNDMIAFFENRGGYIGGYAQGGMVPGFGYTDTVPAMLTPGEIVMRKSAVQQIGARNLLAMNEGAPVSITPTTSASGGMADLAAEVRALRGDLVSTVRYMVRTISPGAGEELAPILRGIEANTRTSGTTTTLADLRASQAVYSR